MNSWSIYLEQQVDVALFRGLRAHPATTSQLTVIVHELGFIEHLLGKPWH